LKKQSKILSSFDFDEYRVSIKDKKISKSKLHFIRKEIKGKINIDSIYFSGEVPSVYFKSITNFNPDNLKEICILHKKIWNQRKVPLLFVSTPTELRIYNCFEEPINPDRDLERLKELELEKYSIKDTEEHLSYLVSVLGRVAIDSSEIWKNNFISQRLKPQKRVDAILVKNLKDTKDILRKRKIPSNVIHDILIRSLFAFYLEDIGASDDKFYDQFKKGAKSYFDLLTDIKATYAFYKFLEKKFNGNLFPVRGVEREKITDADLSLISSCFRGDDISSGQLTFWKKFDFSVIPIELISEIYEIFLNKTDTEKSEQGEYYTPHSLVDFILNKKLPWADKENKNYDIKILDIACGSGIFLVESYRRLVDRWQFTNKKKPGIEDLRKILLNSIYGFEINPESVKVASFSLYLALISYLNPKTIWRRKKVKFPYLIYEPDISDKKKQGSNLYRQSSLSNIIDEQPKFDLIVGNPPFKSAKTGSIEKEASEYCLEKGYAQEMVLPFLDRASYFCNEKGQVAIFSTSKILFNKSGGYQKFRHFLFNENYVEDVFNFSALRRARKGQGKSIFADAVGPACILFYKKNPPDKQKQNITYVCPKPTIRDQFSDELVLDALDFYYLPREECKKPDTIIWKTAMWGTENDFELIQTLSEKKQLNDYLTEKNGWYKGEGFQFLSKKEKKHWQDNELQKMKMIEAKNVQRYFTPKVLIDINESLSKNNIPFYLNLFSLKDFKQLPPINIFRMIGKKETYYAPHLLIKRGQTEKQFCASFLDYDSCFKHSIYGVTFKKEGLSTNEKKIKVNILKALTGYLNSKFASYYLFLSTISWGIEREEVGPNEMLSLPALPCELTDDQITELAEKVDKISEELKRDIFRNDTSSIESEIDEIIYKALNLSQREQYLVEDVFNYGIDLFQEGENSRAFSPVNHNSNELKVYLKILCEDINEHYEFSETRVWASIWEMPPTIPMQLIAVHFTDGYKAGYIHTFKSSEEVNKLIRMIDKYSYKKHSASVYFRKVIKYYKGDVIYIIKPNQKRFWSKSQAMQDSNSILLEIANNGIE
jgi:type I restriction-modification system DNA methylase subunit